MNPLTSQLLTINLFFNKYFSLPGQECDGEESQSQQPGPPVSLQADAAQEESEHLQPPAHQVDII